jgi:hypothetical protein
MNIFGAFTFGSLIKTFLPGFVWLVAIIMLEADVARMLNATPYLWTFVQTKDQAALVLAIPASILLGLLSNVIVFMGINDWLVRGPIKRANPDLCGLYDVLAQRLRTRCWDALQATDPALKTTFDKHVDAEIVLLHTIGVEELAYVREQYWYHLEFQLNLVLSIAAIALALVISVLLGPGSGAARFGLASACVVGAALVMWALVVAARKNYMRHVAKITSIMAAVLCPPAASGQCQV